LGLLVEIANIIFIFVWLSLKMKLGNSLTIGQSSTMVGCKLAATNNYFLAKIKKNQNPYRMPINNIVGFLSNSQDSSHNHSTADGYNSYTPVDSAAAATTTLPTTLSRSSHQHSNNNFFSLTEVVLFCGAALVPALLAAHGHAH
jgi:hypothetical protein